MITTPLIVIAFVIGSLAAIAVGRVRRRRRLLREANEQRLALQAAAKAEPLHLPGMRRPVIKVLADERRPLVIAVTDRDHTTAHKRTSEMPVEACEDMSEDEARVFRRVVECAWHRWQDEAE